MKLFMVLLFFSSWFSYAHDQSPCRKNCERTYSLQGGQELSIYSSYPLHRKNDAITHVIVVIQGAERQAETRFSVMARLTRREHVADNTLVISPHFRTQNDNFNGQPFWSENGWKEGADAIYSNVFLSSFDVIDDILTRILTSGNFNSVTHVTITGHSAGGQFTQMYALTTPIVEQFPLTSFKFVVMNPSSYTYLNNQRLSGGELVPVDFNQDSMEELNESCPNYNDYKFGLDNRPRYSANISNNVLVQRYLKRVVTYALGSADNDTHDPMLNRSCAANLQGSNRYERGTNYFDHLNSIMATHAHHKIVVPFVGHDCARMYSDEKVKAALFTGPQKAKFQWQKQQIILKEKQSPVDRQTPRLPSPQVSKEEKKKKRFSKIKKLIKGNIRKSA